MANVTGTEGRQYTPKELYKLEEETLLNGSPAWVSRELGNQALTAILSTIHSG